MNVAEAGRQAGLTAKAVRFYEAEGLLRPARAANGYRIYGDEDVHRLRFLARSRALGFSIEDCRRLLDLYDNKGRSSSEVKALTENRIGDIDRRIAEMREIRRVLMQLSNSCHGDNRPDCPILDDLAEEPMHQRTDDAA